VRSLNRNFRRSAHCRRDPAHRLPSGRTRPFLYYLQLLQNHGYVYATVWLPHDAQAESLGTGRNIEEMARGAGWRVRIVPRLSVADGINAVRTLFPTIWFDRDAGSHCTTRPRTAQTVPDIALWRCRARARPDTNSPNRGPGRFTRCMDMAGCCTNVQDGSRGAARITRSIVATCAEPG
jgi:hypothetical protein